MCVPTRKPDVFYTSWNIVRAKKPEKFNKKLFPSIPYSNIGSNSKHKQYLNSASLSL